MWHNTGSLPSVSEDHSAYLSSTLTGAGRAGAHAAQLTRLLQGLRPEGRLDLREFPPEFLASRSSAASSTHGAQLHTLLLPDHCTADTLRAWLGRSPNLHMISVSHVIPDGHDISATSSPALRYFKTAFPGPEQLRLPPGAQVVVPDQQARQPCRATLAAWANGTSTPPWLNDRLWTQIEPHFKELEARAFKRDGVSWYIPPGRRIALKTLLECAPPDLLPYAAARNQGRVLSSLGDCRGARALTLEAAEVDNFTKPSLWAAWRLLTREDENREATPRSPEELSGLAQARLRVLNARPLLTEDERVFLTESGQTDV